MLGHMKTSVVQWPSIVYQPISLLKTMRGTYVWSKAESRRERESVQSRS